MQKIILLSLFFLVSIKLHSQNDTLQIKDSPSITNATQNENFTDPAETEPSIKFLSSKEFWLGITVLLVLIILLILIIVFIRKKNISDELAVKLLLTTIVILSSLFLVIAGYNDRTIAPAFGLFGAILGYIFGKSENKN